MRRIACRGEQHYHLQFGRVDLAMRWLASEMNWSATRMKDSPSSRPGTFVPGRISRALMQFDSCRSPMPEWAERQDKSKPVGQANDKVSQLQGRGARQSVHFPTAVGW